MNNEDRFDLFKELCKAADEGDMDRVKLILDMLADCLLEDYNGNY